MEKYKQTSIRNAAKQATGTSEEVGVVVGSVSVFAARS